MTNWGQGHCDLHSACVHSRSSLAKPGRYTVHSVRSGFPVYVVVCVSVYVCACVCQSSVSLSPSLSALGFSVKKGGGIESNACLSYLATQTRDDCRGAFSISSCNTTPLYPQHRWTTSPTIRLKSCSGRFE